MQKRHHLLGIHWDDTGHRISCYALAGILIALIWSLCCGGSRGSVLRVGDLPGMYSLGRIVLEGEGARLYDVDYQRVIQNTFWPELDGGVLPTMYPPIVGAGMALVAWLPPLIARTVMTLTYLCLLIVMVRVCSPDKRLERFTLLCGSMPIFLGLVGTQNTVISAALAVLCRRYLTRGRPMLAGLVAGMMLFKPQIGLMVLSIVIPSAGWGGIAGAAISFLVQYLISMWVFGGEWLVPWARAVQGFADLRRTLDGFQMTSLARGLYPFMWNGTVAELWEVSLCGVLVLFFAIRGFMCRHDLPRRGENLAQFLLLFPLVTPQIMFYDLGISLFFLLSAVPLINHRSNYAIIASVLAINLCVVLRSANLSLVPLASGIVCGCGLLSYCSRVTRVSALRQRA